MKKAIQKLMISVVLAVTLFLLLLDPPTVYAQARSVGYRKNVIGGVGVHWITANLNDRKVAVTPALSPGYSETNETYPLTSLQGITRHYGGTAVINGTFFDMRTSKTVCNIAVNGKLITEGDRGSTIFVDKNNKPGMILTSRLRGRSIDWSNYKWAIQSGPTLLYNGNLVLDPRKEGFTDPSLFRVARRSAIGITQDGKMLFVATSTGATFHQLASIMKSLGAIHATSLDGGTSTGLGYRGNYPVRPGRSLSNFLLVFEDSTNKRLPDYPDVISIINNRSRNEALTYKNRADNLVRQNNFGAAINYYLKACEKATGDISYILTAANWLRNTNRGDIASKYYGKAAISLLENGNSTKAERWAKLSLSLDDRNDYAREVMAILEHYPQYTDAAQLANERNFTRSYEIIYSLLRKNSSQPRFYLTLARIYARAGNREMSAQAYYQASLMFSRQDNRNYEAFIYAQAAVEANPEDREYRRVLANAAAKIGNHQAAEYHRFLSQYLKDTPKVTFTSDTSGVQTGGEVRGQ
jgi:tetratricopeptide (TPR) repeat protein